MSAESKSLYPVPVDDKPTIYSGHVEAKTQAPSPIELTARQEFVAGCRALDIVVERCSLTSVDRSMLMGLLRASGGQNHFFLSSAQFAVSLHHAAGRINRSERERHRVACLIGKRMERLLERLHANTPLIYYKAGEQRGSIKTPSFYDITPFWRLIEDMQSSARPEQVADTWGLKTVPRRGYIPKKLTPVIDAWAALAESCSSLRSDDLAGVGNTVLGKALAQAQALKETIEKQIRLLTMAVAVTEGLPDQPPVTSPSPAMLSTEKSKGGMGGSRPLWTRKGSHSIQSLSASQHKNLSSTSSSSPSSLSLNRYPIVDKHDLDVSTHQWVACLQQQDITCVNLEITKTLSRPGEKERRRHIAYKPNVPLSSLLGVLEKTDPSLNWIVGGAGMGQIDDIPQKHLAAVREFRPHYLVETSPGSYQAWWIIPGITHDLLHHIATTIGGGANVKPHGWGRIPGSLNGKHGCRCRFESTGMTISLAELQSKANWTPPPPPVIPTSTERPPLRFPYYDSVRSRGYGGESYDRYIIRVAWNAGWSAHPRQFADWLARMSDRARAAGDALLYVKQIAEKLIEMPLGHVERSS